MTQQEKKIYKKIKKFCLASKIKICLKRKKTIEVYNGKTILFPAYLSAETGKVDFAEGLHDIAHWLIAPPKRRRMEDFGLGAPGIPDGKYVPIAKADEEEEKASLLGIAMERFLGLDWESTYLNHAWGDSYYWREAMKLEPARSLAKRFLLDRKQFLPSLILQRRFV